MKGLFVSDLDFHFTEYLTENAPKTTTHLSSPAKAGGRGQRSDLGPLIPAFAGMTMVRERI